MATRIFIARWKRARRVMLLEKFDGRQTDSGIAGGGGGATLDSEGDRDAARVPQFISEDNLTPRELQVLDQMA